MHDVLKALEGSSLSTNECLLPLSFVGDGVTGNEFKSDCFLATGDDGISGVFSGSSELMVVKVVCRWVIGFSGKLNNNENTG